MVDNVQFQSGTPATAPATLLAETRDQGSGVERQVVSDVTVVNPSATFTRPANTTAYTIGDIIANSVTAGSVAPLQFAAANGNAVTQSKATLAIRRCKIKTSSLVVTLFSFRLHLFQGDPSASSGIINGDNGVYSVNDASALYLGAMDVTSGETLADCSIGFGVPNQGSEINVVPASGNIFGLLEARAAYVPTSGDVFTVYLECWQF